MSYSVQNLSDVLESGGEEFAKALAAGFTCKHNKEIDDYLRDDAIDFTRRSMTITHLVFENETGVLLGYFALTHKPLTFVGENLSANKCKRMERFAKINEGKYMVSAYLIAQIGKNYAEDDGRKISGKDLLDLAKQRVDDRQTAGRWTSRFRGNGAGQRIAGEILQGERLCEVRFPRIRGERQDCDL